MWRPQSKLIVRCSLLICVVSRVLLFQNHELTFVPWLMTFVTFVCVYITALLSIHICQGMLSIPPNCERDSCLAYAQWTQVDSATVQFELEATSEGWVAVGVSADQVMGLNGIDDVFACQRDGTTDTVYAQDTYNPQSPRGNIRDTVSGEHDRMEANIMQEKQHMKPCTIHCNSRTKVDFN